MKYFYKQTERSPDLFTVGYEDTGGDWHPTSDHSNREDAEDKVHYLNGGNVPNDSSKILESGMALRDYFAAKAMMNQNWEKYKDNHNNPRYDIVAKRCYNIADAMLKASEKQAK